MVSILVHCSVHGDKKCLLQHPKEYYKSDPELYENTTTTTIITTTITTTITTIM